MISKTLGQLTQDETRLWEQAFCSSLSGLPNIDAAAEEADGVIASLRKYHAESAAETRIERIVRLLDLVIQAGANGAGVQLTASDAKILADLLPAPSSLEPQEVRAPADPRDPPHEGGDIASWRNTFRDLVDEKKDPTP